VAMFYIPCIATIAALVKEFSWKAAATISLANTLFAILIGGLAFRLLSLFL
jgi:ferrous iron transport protein B